MKKAAKTGQSLVEYLGAILVATTIIVSLIVLTPGVLQTFFNDVFDSVATQLV